MTRPDELALPPASTIPGPRRGNRARIVRGARSVRPDRLCAAPQTRSSRPAPETRSTCSGRAAISSYSSCLYGLRWRAGLVWVPLNFDSRQMELAGLTPGSFSPKLDASTDRSWGAEVARGRRQRGARHPRRLPELGSSEGDALDASCSDPICESRRLTREDPGRAWRCCHLGTNGGKPRPGFIHPKRRFVLAGFPLNQLAIARFRGKIGQATSTAPYPCPHAAGSSLLKTLSETKILYFGGTVKEVPPSRMPALSASFRSGRDPPALCPANPG